MQRGASLRRRQWSLAALLDEAADELLRVGLQDAVDLVEDAVDVGVQVLLAGGGLGRRWSGLGGLVGSVVASLWSALLLAGHWRDLSLVILQARGRAAAHEPSPNLSRCGGQLTQEGGRVRTAVKERTDGRLGAPQRFEHRDPLERRLARDVEDHRVPGCGRDLVGVLRQALPAEVRPGVHRRLVDSLEDDLI